MNPATFEEKVAHGREYEIAVSRWLQRRGWLVLPAYDYSGKGDSKAPKLIGLQQQLVVPDLLACRAGKVRWFEVKWKQGADFTYTTQRLETGINLRLWRHYQQVREASGQEVWIVFVHVNEGEVRAAEIERLATVARESPRFDRGRGGVFFPWEWMQVIAPYAEVVRENDYFARDGAA